MARRREKRITVAQIAASAGVSKATVDRVINGRNSVQPHTRNHVERVIQSLRVDNAPENKTSEKALHLDFFIPDNHNNFLAQQADYIDTYAKSLQSVSVRIHRLANASEEAVLTALKALSDNTDGVGIIAMDTPKIREALGILIARKIPIVTLASDISKIGRCAYIGIDNFSAGKLAGYLMGRFIQRENAKVSLILGLRSYRGHEEREMGFRSILRDKFPQMEIIGESEIGEDDRRASDAVVKMLNNHPDLAGIYCVGAGQLGLIQTLDARNIDDKICVIGHGLTGLTQRYLIDGSIDVVIHEDAQQEARDAVDHLVAIGRSEATPVLRPIAIEAIFSENIVS